MTATRINADQTLQSIPSSVIAPANGYSLRGFTGYKLGRFVFMEVGITFPSVVSTRVDLGTIATLNAAQYRPLANVNSPDPNALVTLTTDGKFIYTQQEALSTGWTWMRFLFIAAS